jgi:type IV pilus assembly protein PilB
MRTAKGGGSETFARFLTSRGLVGEAELRSAIDFSRRMSMTLADAVVASGLLGERDAYGALAESGGDRFIDLAGVVPSPMAVKLVPERVARRHRLVPVCEDNRTLTFASSAGFDPDAERDVAFASGRRPERLIAVPSQIDAALNSVYSAVSGVDELIDRIRHAGAVEIADAKLSVSAGDSPVIDLCNRILAAAIHAGASDVHVEPGPAGALVRHRICGILEPLLTLPSGVVARVTNRFKILARADIAIRHKPQDGAFRIAVDERQLDVRLSVLPTTHGEKLVMRVIDSASAFQSFDALGYDEQACGAIRTALTKADGLVLFTGPTGSGKTTALYAALQLLRTSRVNIVTVEDPVERYLAGVTQIPVNSRNGTGFAGVLRSVMRQDPNIIMVGEIRDQEVAEIVGQAAYTGHLVLSSLHTTDAASAITRLLNLGLAPFKVAESLNAVVAQRLLRKLCPFCRVTLDEFSARRLGARLGQPAAAATLGPGCDRCKNTGYLGRIAVPEILVPDTALRRAIRDGAGATEIRAAMHAAGGLSMREAALTLVAQGITSIEEVDRVLTSHTDQPARGEQPGRRTRVLVTDDDRMIRMLVRILLEKAGYEVLEAADGALAIELARRERPDLVLCDLMMPGMDGFETISRMRRDIALAAVPVMVLTADNTPGVEQRVLELGADDYLVKPFEAPVLVSRVQALFRRVSRAVAAA